MDQDEELFDEIDSDMEGLMNLQKKKFTQKQKIYDEVCPFYWIFFHFGPFLVQIQSLNDFGSEGNRDFQRIRMDSWLLARRCGILERKDTWLSTKTFKKGLGMPARAFLGQKHSQFVLFLEATAASPTHYSFLGKSDGEKSFEVNTHTGISEEIQKEAFL